MPVRTNPLAGTTHSFLTPLTRAGRRFAFHILLSLSLAILIVGRANPGLTEAARATVGDLIAPVLEAARAPATAVKSVADRVHNMTTLYTENEQLTTENATLLQWQAVARQLQSENAGLRELLHYQPPATTWFVTARVIGTEGGAFSRVLLVDQGSANGVAEGQAVLTGAGLVGRVTRVGQHTASVLLLTDVNSRIPVSIEPARTRAILSGDNNDQPELAYVPSHAKVQIGDRIVTSGDGGVFPPGLPVGVVAADEGDILTVQPYADPEEADYLRIADFGLAGVLPASAVPLPKPVHSHHTRHERGGHGAVSHNEAQPE